jgi:hypothetical protein
MSNNNTFSMVPEELYISKNDAVPIIAGITSIGIILQSFNSIWAVIFWRRDRTPFNVWLMISHFLLLIHFILDVGI